MLATVTLLSATAANASSHHKRSPRCVPHRARAHVLKADRLAELYTAPEDPEYPEFLGVYGCTYKHKRSYLLGSVPPKVATPSGTGGVEKATMAGSFVAYEESSGGPTGASWVITVRNLENGKVKHSVPTGTPEHPEAPSVEKGLVKHYVGIGPATAVVVNRDGSVAWIVNADKEEGSYQVHVFDQAGNRVLASGLGIEPHSLRLAGRVLHWTEYGQLKSAPID